MTRKIRFNYSPEITKNVRRGIVMVISINELKINEIRLITNKNVVIKDNL